MTRKKFDPKTNNLVDASEIDPEVVAERIYDELGERIPLEFRGLDATVYVDTENLPDGVQESKVKNAIQKSHPRANGDPT